MKTLEKLKAEMDAKRAADRIDYLTTRLATVEAERDAAVARADAAENTLEQTRAAAKQHYWHWVAKGCDSADAIAFVGSVADVCSNRAKRGDHLKDKETPR